MVSVTVNVTHRSARVLVSAVVAACSTATRVLSRHRGPASLVSSASMAATPASMRVCRAAASRPAFAVECTHTMRWPSCDGVGAGDVEYTSSGSARRGPGRRAVSVQVGVWVCSHRRNWPSSLRLRGKTVTNRPWREAMWPIASRKHNLESAT